MTGGSTQPRICETMFKEPEPFWPPIVGGVALGLALLLAFLVTGHGLGASGFFTRFAAVASGWLAEPWAQANAYFAPFLAGNALATWITWEVIGIGIGALAGSLTAGRFRPQVERGRGAGVGGRLAYAFAGGALAGFGARLARGCTSGLGLSGGATLAVAGFVFLLAFFAAGLLVSLAMRREWQ